MPRPRFPRPCFPSTAALALIVLAALAATAPHAGAQGRVRHVSYSAGEVIPVRLSDELSSDKSRRGDRFTAAVDSDQKGYGYLRGAKVEGRVTEARRKEGDKPGVLDMEFTRLRTENGQSYEIHGSVIGLDNREVERRDDGVLVAKPGEKKNHLEYAGIGAGAGALVSLLGNGKLKLENVLLGGALGAGAAELSKGKSQTRDVTLKPGTKMGVRLDRPFNYRAY